MYDADSYAPAHFLMPTRLGSLSNGTVDPAVAAISPGFAGRWQLGEDLSPLKAMASMATRVNRMYSTYVTYYMVQGLVLIGLLIRLIMYLAFQKRLSVIGGTLVSLI